MADARLTTFVEAALNARASKDDVRKALGQAGWSREQIDDGLAHFADVAFAVPVPRPRKAMRRESRRTVKLLQKLRLLLAREPRVEHASAAARPGAAA